MRLSLPARLLRSPSDGASPRINGLGGLDAIKHDTDQFIASACQEKAMIGLSCISATKILGDLTVVQLLLWEGAAPKPYYTDDTFFCRE